MLTPVFRDSWRLEELTVNYRTPALVSEVAESMAIEAGVPVTPTRAVRTGEWPVGIVRTDPDGLLEAAVDAVALVRADGSGTIAVIAVDGVVDAVHAALRDRIPGEVARGAMGLRRAVAVLTPGEAKGLEFDAVVVVEPTAIVESGPRGAGALYVAMTRPTQRLVLVAARALPAGIEAGIELAAAASRA